MTPLPWKRVLIVAPHTDDEYGCAGTIARLVREGNAEIRYRALSDCVESVPEGLPRNALRREAFDAMCALRVNHAYVGQWPVRYFTESRQGILEELVKVRDNYHPDCVLAPSRDDIHQDHATVAAECLRAFKHTTILGYELPQNSVAFDNAVYVHLTPADVFNKMAALGRYKSQKGRPYMDPRVMDSIMRLRGMQAGTEFAEAFEPIRIHL